MFLKTRRRGRYTGLWLRRLLGGYTYQMGLTSSHLIWRCLHVEQPLRLRL